MKTALVVGVRIDQTREVLSCGLEFDEARQMVTAAIEPGSDAAELGYEMVELHMISRGSRVKACKVNHTGAVEDVPAEDVD